MEETRFNFNKENANPSVRPETVTGTHDQKVRAGISLGTIPTGVVDSGTTSHIGTKEDEEELIPTNKKSRKLFSMPNGETEAATRQALLNHDLQEQARTVDIVPGVTTATLISTSKLTDANYTRSISIFALLLRNEVW